VFLDDECAQLLPHERREQGSPTTAVECRRSTGPLAADDDQAAAGRDGAAQPLYRVSSEYVHDAVVAHAAVGEVLTGVFDDMVGAERADHLDVADAAHRGELGTGGFGELHGE